MLLTSYKTVVNTEPFSEVEVCQLVVFMCIAVLLLNAVAGEKDGVISETFFWTLPQLGTPYILDHFTVRPGSNFLQTRWSNQQLQCIGSYIVKICESSLEAGDEICTTEIVTKAKR